MIEETNLTALGLVAARVVLSAIFLVAGLAKLLDQVGTRQALVDFGVPARVAPALAVALPITELAVAIGLIPVASAWLGALGALALLLAFTAAIGVNLALGRTPDCHCFGQLHSSPAGWSTLARNGVFVAIAGFLVWAGQTNPTPSLFGWFTRLPASERILWLSGVLSFSFLATLLVQILKQQGRILLRLDALDGRLGGAASALPSLGTPVGLPIGSIAPDFRLESLDGKLIALADMLSAAKPLVLVFTNPHCGPCLALLPELSRWQREHAAKLTVALVSEGSRVDNRAKSNELGLAQVLLQEKREVAEKYQAWGTPSAVLIRPDRTIGSPVAQGAEGIRALFAYSLSAPTASPATRSSDVQTIGARGASRAKLGDPAPALKLRDLNGKTAALADFRGRKTMVLFWDPKCGFCQQMLPDLQHWDADPGPRELSLVVVSNGTVEEGRAMGLRSAVLLDPSRQAATAFDAPGTPSAVLIDAEGRIDSEVAAGAPAVWKLGRARQDVIQTVSELAN